MNKNALLVDDNRRMTLQIEKRLTSVLKKILAYDIFT